MNNHLSRYKRLNVIGISQVFWWYLNNWAGWEKAMHLLIIRRGKSVIVDIIIIFRARVIKIMCWRFHFEAVFAFEQCYIEFYVNRIQRRKRGRKHDPPHFLFSFSYCLYNVLAQREDGNWLFQNSYVSQFRFNVGTWNFIPLLVVTE